MEQLWVGVIAVVGTLLGAVVSGKFQERAANRVEAGARGEQLRRDRLNAVQDLAEAISTHRSLMWRRGDAVLKGSPADRVEALRIQTQESRSRITRPLVGLRLLVTDPAVRTAANRMITLTYAIRETHRTAPEGEEARAAAVADLTKAREEARQAHDDFVEAAAAYFDRTA